ncbi:anti-sigma factor family protein [Alloalcanivorax sp. C16-1]|uniref:anti-sigma factor family protein n=1 Tax=Alloalcanivorax sp. C16-1 TaxID=3390051 RepID=UPI003970F3A8
MWPRNRSLDHAVTDQELSAFADGQLPRHRARQVARQLRAHPEYADRIHAYWRREAALQRALNPVFLTPVSPPVPAPRRRWTWVAAAGLATGTVLSVLVWRGTGVAPLDFTELALRAYAGAPGAVSLGPAPPAPFQGLDLEPVSRRTVRIEGDRLVEYRYRDPQGREMALYEMDRGASVDDGWFHVMSRQERPLVRWSQGERNYVLVGDGGLAHLTGLALEMRGRLAPLPADPSVPTVPETPGSDRSMPAIESLPGAAGGDGVQGRPLPQDAGLATPERGAPAIPGA